jgi:hypothetical protein
MKLGIRNTAPEPNSTTNPSHQSVCVLILTVGKQRFGRHVPVVKNTRNKDELLAVYFSIRSVLYRNETLGLQGNGSVLLQASFPTRSVSYQWKVDDYIFLELNVVILTPIDLLTTDPEVPGSIPGHYKKKVVGLERDPLSLVSTTDGLYGQVVRVPGYRSRGPCSIPTATRFSEKWWVWNGVHSAS